MEQLSHDVRYGLRTFIRQPAFALTAVLALALGIGANTAVFSVVYAVLLKPLPYPNPDALVYVHDTYPAVTFASVSINKYLALRDGNRTLEALGAQTPAGVTLTDRGEPEQVGAMRVSADLFRVMGVPAAYGRWFSRDEDVPNASPVIVLSHGLWQRRYGSDPEIVGQAVTVDGVATTVVGVMPPGFTYPGSSQAWVPLAPARTAGPGSNFLRLVGRMKPGGTVEQTQRDLASVSARFNKENNLQRDVRVWALHEIVVTDNKQALLVLQGAVVFVLLVACANVANLLLARSVGRQRELAIRAAIGAGRGRLVRQLLTESVLLSVLGGAVGVIVAGWLLRLFVALAPANFPRVQSIAIDTSVLTFTLVVATVTGLIFGLAPARRGFRTDPNDSLRDTGARGASSGGSRGASRVLVIAEVGVALVLVIGAGLMVKSLLRLQSERTGFRSEGLLTFELNLPSVRYPDATPVTFFQRTLEEIRSVPGVQGAGAINHLPLARFGFNGGFTIDGRPPFPRDTAPVVEVRIVTPGYFAVMCIPVRRGQDFSELQSASGPPVMIVNQAMADRYWPGQDPVGGRVQLVGDRWREVVGVVGDVRSARMRAAPVPETFVPHAQAGTSSMGIAVRLGGVAPSMVWSAVRERITLLDVALPLVRVRPMQEIVEASTGDTRLSSVLTTMFGLVAALLAGVGIYSLIAYSVAQRSREIGIRVALGADRAAVIRLIVGEGLTLAAIGLVAGVAGSMLLTRTLETLLYEVSPTDPVVLMMTCAGGLALAALASAVPAFRALRVDPAIALRSE
jgi:putative ABC transport system permease protein